MCQAEGNPVFLSSPHTDTFEVSLDSCGNFISYIFPSCFSGNSQTNPHIPVTWLPAAFPSRHLRLENSAGHGQAPATRASTVLTPSGWVSELWSQVPPGKVSHKPGLGRGCFPTVQKRRLLAVKLENPRSQDRPHNALVKWDLRPASPPCVAHGVGRCWGRQLHVMSGCPTGLGSGSCRRFFSADLFYFFSFFI